MCIIIYMARAEMYLCIASCVASMNCVYASLKTLHCFVFFVSTGDVWDFMIAAI